MRYFQIMVWIGDSWIPIPGLSEQFDDDSEAEIRKFQIATIRKLSKKKPQYVLAEVNEAAVGFANKKRRKTK